MREYYACSNNVTEEYLGTQRKAHEILRDKGNSKGLFIINTFSFVEKNTNAERLCNHKAKSNHFLIFLHTYQAVNSECVNTFLTIKLFKKTFTTLISAFSSSEKTRRQQQQPNERAQCAHGPRHLTLACSTTGRV